MRRRTAQTDPTEHRQTDPTEHSTDRCDRVKSIAIAMYKVVVQLGGLSLEIEEYQPSSILGWRN